MSSTDTLRKIFFDTGVVVLGPQMRVCLVRLECGEWNVEEEEMSSEDRTLILQDDFDVGCE